jgi:hypothetical protein
MQHTTERLRIAPAESTRTYVPASRRAGLLDRIGGRQIGAFFWNAGRALRARSAHDSDNTELEQLRAACADDLRSWGWTVTLHQDYRLNGQPMTRWLLTKDERFVTGEGATDAEALREIRRKLAQEAERG